MAASSGADWHWHCASQRARRPLLLAAGCWLLLLLLLLLLVSLDLQ
eukprot:COSAG06_NODE_6124_length_3081_cov_1.946298_1_plen_45_part_10